jgi:hypothetical protein
MPLREFVNRHCDGNVRAARSCAGSGRRKHSREGSAESSRLDAVIASIVARRSIMREVAIARKRSPQLQSNSGINITAKLRRVAVMSTIDKVQVGNDGTMTEVKEVPIPRRQMPTVAAQLSGGAYPNFLTTPCSRNAHSMLQ